jgi:hypothetical protein
MFSVIVFPHKQKQAMVRSSQNHKKNKNRSPAMVHSSSALVLDLPGLRQSYPERERERERETRRDAGEREGLGEDEGEEGRKVYSKQKAMNEVDAGHDRAGGRLMQ